MTRAAFLSVPAHGHVNPTLPLVGELVRRGEDVTYFSTEEFRDRIERTGARFRLYPSFAYDTSHPDANFFDLAAALSEISLAMLPQILGDLRSGDFGYVLHDSMAPWGSYAARILGLPAVCSTPTFAIGPLTDFSLRSLAEMAGMAMTGIGGLLRLKRAGRRLRDQYGVEGASFPEIFANRGDLTLVYTSRRFQPEAERFDESVRFVGPSLPALSPSTDPLLAELDAACADGRPLVYVSLGTVFNDRPDFFRTCVEAFGGSGMQVLIASGNKVRIESLGPLPSNVCIRPSVPQLEVLQRARLFVTHGGMNSVNEGLYFGVPLLLRPQMNEQAMVARRVEALGAGRILRGRSISPAALATAARDLLGDSSYRQKARWLGESLAEAGGCARAAGLVIEFSRARAAGKASDRTDDVA